MIYTATVQVWDDPVPYTKTLGTHPDLATARSMVEEAARNGFWEGPMFIPPHRIMAGSVIKPGEEVPWDLVVIGERA